MSPDAPDPDVLRAFGAGAADPVRMSGGRGLTWLAGDVILRPHGDVEESSWKSEVLAALTSGAGFRTARPVRSAGGGWQAGGWEAWQWLEGTPDETRVIDVIRAGQAFHEAIVALPEPAFIGRSADAWSRADRMAWGEEPLPSDDLLRRLAERFRTVASPAQVIHGDLLGNVLFAEAAAPAIIDWAPYWRPTGYAAAIVAVDAVCWHGWPTSRIDEAGSGIPEWEQFLLRALSFRMATLHNLGVWDSGLRERHEPVVDRLVSLSARRSAA